MWTEHMPHWYCKGQKARRALKDTEVSDTSCFFFILSLSLFLPPPFKHNTVGHIHTQRTAVIWVLCKGFSHKLLGMIFKASQFGHRQANYVTYCWDQKCFHSLLTGGNVASNWKGVPFIIRRSDTDEILGEGGQRSQDSGCCSARNLDLQWRSCTSVRRGAWGPLQRA